MENILNIPREDQMSSEANEEPRKGILLNAPNWAQLLVLNSAYLASSQAGDFCGDVGAIFCYVGIVLLSLYLQLVKVCSYTDRTNDEHTKNRYHQ